MCDCGCKLHCACASVCFNPPLSLKVGEGVRVVVQPSRRRVFADAEYVAAGAEIDDDLSSAQLILGGLPPF